MQRNARVDEHQDARSQLDTRYRRALLRFFSRRVNARVEAEDLTQEVFVRLLRRGDGIDPATMDAYVFQIATNLIRDRRRRDATSPDWAHVSAPSVDGSSGICERALAEERSPDRVLAGKDDLAAVMRVLDELGPRTRDIFLLFRTERMKQKEIAAAFGISISMVEKLIVKATAHLARRFVR